MRNDWSNLFCEKLFVFMFFTFQRSLKWRSLPESIHLLYPKHLKIKVHKFKWCEKSWARPTKLLTSQSIHWLCFVFSNRCQQTYHHPVCHTIWYSICSDKRWEIMLCHNAQHHLGTSDNWMFFVSLTKCTCSVWRNVLSHIFSEHRMHFKPFLDSLFTLSCHTNLGDVKCLTLYKTLQ